MDEFNANVQGKDTKGDTQYIISFEEAHYSELWQDYLNTYGGTTAALVRAENAKDVAEEDAVRLGHVLASEKADAEPVAAERDANPRARLHVQQLEGKHSEALSEAEASPAVAEERARLATERAEKERAELKRHKDTHAALSPRSRNGITHQQPRALSLEALGREIGQVVSIDTEDGVEEGVVILGPSTSGSAAEVRVRFADGTVDDWEVDDFISHDYPTPEPELDPDAGYIPPRSAGFQPGALGRWDAVRDSVWDRKDPRVEPRGVVADGQLFAASAATDLKTEAGGRFSVTFAAEGPMGITWSVVDQDEGERCNLKLCKPGGQAAAKPLLVRKSTAAGHLVLVSVDGKATDFFSYQQQMQLVKTAGRPCTLRFEHITLTLVCT